MSIFRFKSKELERQYQDYLRLRPDSWAYLTQFLALVGWSRFAVHYYFAHEDERAVVPSAWYIGLSHAVVAILLLSVMAFKRATYSKHRRVINLCYVVFVLLTLRYVLLSMLWLQWLAVQRGEARTPLGLLQSFFVENWHIVKAPLLVFAFPTGQLLDVLLASVFLFHHLAIGLKQTACGLDLLSDGMAMRSPALAWSARAVSNSAIALGVPGGTTWEPMPAEACPAALLLFQVVGWWLACHTILLADIARRREFLRSADVLARLQSSQRAAALKWPFGGARRAIVLLMASTAVTFQASLIWCSALWLLV